MKRRRARILAAAIVLSTAATAAYGDWHVTSDPAQSGSAAFGSPMAVLVSLRNTTGTALTIGSITKSSPPGTTCWPSITLAPLTGSFPVTVGVNQQAQFVVSTTGISMVEATAGTPTCMFDINESPPGPAEHFSATFHVMASADPWDLQPKLTDFGTQPTFEIQRVFIQNNGTSGSASYMTAMINDATLSMTFSSICPGLQSCPNLVFIGAGQYQSIDIKCAPTIAGPIAGSLSIYGASGLLGTKSLACTGVTGATITVAPPMLDITAMQGSTNMGSAFVSNTGMADWSMIAAELNGDLKNLFHFTDPMCSPHACTFSPVVGLPSSLEIACTPIDATTQSATLVVHGIGGPSDFATSTVRCIPSGGGGGPVIMVSPMSIAAPMTAVNGTAGPFPLTITNTGNGTLSAQLSFGTSTEWTATGCVGVPCMLNGAGSNATVDVMFTPIAYGDRSASLTITSNDTAGNTSLGVGLSGSGSGGTLEVTSPVSPFDINFGTIPKGAPSTQPLTMLEMGNVGIMVNATGATSPFTVTPGTVNLNPGTPDSFTVGCGSSNPGGPYSTTITLASTAYQQNTQTVTAHCTIADTQVEVTPTTFAFGEVRVGAAAVDIPLAIHNPTSQSVTLHALHLGGSSTVLSLSPTISSDMAIPGGGTVNATLHLATTQDSDVAGTQLLIDVDTSHLSYPISGKVVTPSAHVAPATLDLGTACLGSQVSGTVMMINDGTATLTMQRPTMDQAFTPVYQMPSTYPAPLLAGHSAMVGITPSTSAAGTIGGTMTWDIDAPDAPFHVPVSLTYVPDGTAVSPRALEFGRLAVDTRSGKQLVTLENCDLAPAEVTIGGVLADTGAASAWDVEPHLTQTTLGAHAKLTIAVDFAPPKVGHYAARIQLTVAGQDSTIALTGDATGLTPDATSFYACTCNGPGAPSRGWPIAVAVAVVVVRRRRHR